MSIPDNSIGALFDISDRVAVITGAAGLLGRRHALTVARMGGVPVLLDIEEEAAESAASEIRSGEGYALGLHCDVRSPESLEQVRRRILDELGRVDILINNAAHNPKMESETDESWSRLESFPVELWDADIAVGLTGAFLASQIFGNVMAEAGKGVILNVGSDLGLIGPDQRLYRQGGKGDNEQPVKPVTYSVVKAGLLGLTRYLATYWADRGVRTNYIAPGGVETSQAPEFVQRIADLIPMGRMARIGEYDGAIAFLISDASSYMNGAVLSVDGGRTAW